MTILNNNALYGRVLDYLIEHNNLVAFKLESIDNLPTANLTVQIKTNDAQVWTIEMTYHLAILSVHSRHSLQHTAHSLRSISDFINFLHQNKPG